jgi:hypothetical protein
MRYSIFILSAIIILSSCSSKFSLQKRKYNKGFYFATQSKTPSKKDNHSIKAVHEEEVKEHVATELVHSLANEKEIVSPAESVSVSLTQKKQSVSGKKLVKQAKQHFEVNTLKFKKQIAETKQEIKKAKLDIFDIVRTMYVGYIAITLISIVIFLFIELPFLEALSILAILLLGCLILYGIGTLFT